MDRAKTEGLIQYEFVATFRRYNEDACSWNFLFMPKELAKEICEISNGGKKAGDE